MYYVYITHHSILFLVYMTCHMHVTRRTHIRDVTHGTRTHDIRICDTMHSYAWHDSLIYALTHRSFLVYECTAYIYDALVCECVTYAFTHVSLRYVHVYTHICAVTQSNVEPDVLTYIQAHSYTHTHTHHTHLHTQTPHTLTHTHTHTHTHIHTYTHTHASGGCCASARHCFCW